jgi:flavin-dependent dehydrogenase
VLATGCPCFPTFAIGLGAFQLVAEVSAGDGVAGACAPRRTVLDKILLDAAAESGVEVREGFSVTGLTSSGDRVTGIRGRGQAGAEVEERARIVIGADGRNSLVARTVGAAEYNVRPALSCTYYAYWSNVSPHLPGFYPRPRRLVVSFPTNEGLTITPVIFPRDEFNEIRSCPGRHVVAALGLVADLAEPFRRAVRVGRVMGSADLPNFFRKPYGDGWALVGDAGYHKDPFLAQGISDAFRSAQWLADAVHAGLSGARPLHDALAEYQRARDEHFMPMYELTCGLASFEPAAPEMLALYEALRHDQVETNRFFGTLTGTVPIPDFYAPENIRRIIRGAPAA